MQIKALFRYDDEGHVQPKNHLDLNTRGIQDNRERHLWRQVLLLPQDTLQEHNLKPASLRENILIEGTANIHDLPSGTVIGIGEVELRLTFHCEPCRKISHLVPPRKIIHQRGYLAQIIKPGRICVGESIHPKEQRFEKIPYAAGERIRWYLDQIQQPIMAAQLVKNTGLPKSYCRALPALMRRFTDLERSKIRFASQRG